MYVCEIPLYWAAYAAKKLAERMCWLFTTTRIFLLVLIGKNVLVWVILIMLFAETDDWKDNIAAQVVDSKLKKTIIIDWIVMFKIVIIK